MAKTKAKPIRTRKPASKKDKIIKLLKRPNGASIAELGKVIDWQDHSVRGFMSGTLKKRLKLNIHSNKDDRGVRRYRIVDDVKCADQAAMGESTV